MKSANDHHFLELAMAERAGSDDPKALTIERSAVGAVIVRDGCVLAKSANVLPPALKLHREDSARIISEEERYHYIEHAERAAIFKAFVEAKSTEGSTLYCTRFACSDCARAIAWAGITRVVFATHESEETRWLDSQRHASQILRDAGIKVEILARVDT